MGWQIYNSATTTSVNQATLYTVDFGAEALDSDGFHDNSVNPSRVTIPTGKAGKYAISYTVQWSGGTAGWKQVEIHKNGSVVTAARVAASSTDTPTSISDGVILDLAVGDYVQMKLYQTTGGAINIWGIGIGNGYSTQMNGTFLGA